MRSINLIVFDLDGTLVDTLDDITASVNFTMTRLGSPELSRDAVRQYVGDGIETLMQRCLGSRAGEAAGAVPVYREHHGRNLVVRSHLYPGVAETLEQFYPLPMAVISNKSLEFIKPLLDGLGISGYFRMIIGADSGLPLKPAPDALRKIMQELGAPADRTVMVGDGTTDMISGKAAGAITCGVTYGFRSEDVLAKTGPDFLIREFRELKNLFTAG